MKVLKSNILRHHISRVSFFKGKLPWNECLKKCAMNGVYPNFDFFSISHVSYNSVLYISAFSRMSSIVLPSLKSRPSTMNCFSLC